MEDYLNPLLTQFDFSCLRWSSVCAIRLLCYFELKILLLWLVQMSTVRKVSSVWAQNKERLVSVFVSVEHVFTSCTTWCYLALLSDIRQCTNPRLMILPSSGPRMHHYQSLRWPKPKIKKRERKAAQVKGEHVVSLPVSVTAWGPYGYLYSLSYRQPFKHLLWFLSLYWHPVSRFLFQRTAAHPPLANIVAICVK